MILQVSVEGVINGYEPFFGSSGQCSSRTLFCVTPASHWQPVPLMYRTFGSLGSCEDLQPVSGVFGIGSVVYSQLGVLSTTSNVQTSWQVPDMVQRLSPTSEAATRHVFGTASGARQAVAKKVVQLSRNAE